MYNVIGSEKRGNFALIFTTFQTVTTPRPSEPFVSCYIALGLLLHSSNIKSYSISPVSSGEPPK